MFKLIPIDSHDMINLLELINAIFQNILLTLTSTVGTYINSNTLLHFNNYITNKSNVALILNTYFRDIFITAIIAYKT